MFNKEKIERLESRLEKLEDKIRKLIDYLDVYEEEYIVEGLKVKGIFWDYPFKLTSKIETRFKKRGENKQKSEISEAEKRAYNRGYHAGRKSMK